MDHKPTSRSSLGRSERPRTSLQNVAGERGDGKNITKAYGNYVKSREKMSSKSRESDVSRYEGQILLNRQLTQERQELTDQLEDAQQEIKELQQQLEESSDDSDDNDNSEDKLRILELEEQLRTLSEELERVVEIRLNKQKGELRDLFETELEEQGRLFQLEFNTELSKELTKQRKVLEAEVAEHLAKVDHSNGNGNGHLEQENVALSEHVQTLEQMLASSQRETKLNLATLEQQQKRIEELESQVNDLYTKTSSTLFAGGMSSSSAGASSAASSRDPEKGQRAAKTATSQLKSTAVPKTSSIFSPVASKATPPLKPQVGVSSLSMSPYLKLGKDRAAAKPIPGTSLAASALDSPTTSTRAPRVKNKPPLPMAATPGRKIAEAMSPRKFVPKGNLFDSPMARRPSTGSSKDEAAPRSRKSRRSMMFDSVITKSQTDSGSSESPKRANSSPPPEENKPKKRRKLLGLVVDEIEDGEVKAAIKQKRVKRSTVTPATSLFGELSPEKLTAVETQVSPRRSPRRR